MLYWHSSDFCLRYGDLQVLWKWLKRPLMEKKSAFQQFCLCCCWKTLSLLLRVHNEFVLTGCPANYIQISSSCGTTESVRAKPGMYGHSTIKLIKVRQLVLFTPCNSLMVTASPNPWGCLWCAGSVTCATPHSSHTTLLGWGSSWKQHNTLYPQGIWVLLAWGIPCVGCLHKWLPPPPRPHTILN